ncbi:MAG: abortive infection family protein [Gammaproteobacteria bacterium]|nr:abortive infection family protein [Gammaproteobacteria bacterium]
MKKEIPAPVIAILAEWLPAFESHAGLDSLFLYADAPGDPPEGSKPTKTQAWLRRTNKETNFPLKVLGKLIESYMELPIEKEIETDFLGNPVPNSKLDFKRKLITVLERCNLTYIQGGHISDGRSMPSKSLSEVIRDREIPTIEAEFTRALSNINSNPREAVSAACNILESVFKVYIEDEKLEMPQKEDLGGVWRVVREHLGFTPGGIADNDLKKILTGLLSIVDGIGAFRTHVSSAHGQGRKSYKLKPRHARLAINSAHTLALFVIETWDEKKSASR